MLDGIRLLCCLSGLARSHGPRCLRACSGRWGSRGGRGSCILPLRFRLHLTLCAWALRSRAGILRGRAHAGLWAPARNCTSYVVTGMVIRWRESTGRRLRALVQLVTREFSEDRHLDILIAIDAGRFSRVRAGALDRLGHYANVAARFAEIVTPNDDRIGLMVFSDRSLVECAPARGLPAVTRIRRALEGLSVESAESDPTAAAVRIRGLLKRRGLVVLLTDLDDANVADSLARAVRLLSPPHFVVVAGIRSPDIAALAVGEARTWSDPWVALAAQEHEARVALQRLLLRRLGAPVIVTSAELLEKTLLAEYEALRRSRRV